MKTYGWGILGPGRIAHRFLHDLPRCEQAGLAAVASRDLERARSFAGQYGFRKAYGSYGEMLQDPDVAIVYVATPHPQHAELVQQALDAKKAVLCEKPVAVNGRQARQMVASAAENRQFFMEAMWTRFFPVNRQVKALIASGALGAVTLIEVDFGFGNWPHGPVDHPESRIYAPQLAGGSLLDVGVYCVSYATWMKGERPTAIKALSTRVSTGVDGMTAALFQYRDGAMAVLRSSVIQATRLTATIYCEKATVEVPDFYHPEQAIVRSRSGDVEDQVIRAPYSANGATGFDFEARELMRCLDEGLLESPLMTWQQSVVVMDLLDEIRQDIGLIFPMD